MYKQIVESNSIDFPKEISSAARDLICKLLQKDPEARITGDQIREHSFFACVDWDRLQSLGYVPPFIPGLVLNTPEMPLIRLEFISGFKCI